MMVLQYFESNSDIRRSTKGCSRGVSKVDWSLKQNGRTQPLDHLSKLVRAALEENSAGDAARAGVNDDTAVLNGQATKAFGTPGMHHIGIWSPEAGSHGSHRKSAVDAPDGILGSNNDSNTACNAVLNLELSTDRTSICASRHQYTNGCTTYRRRRRTSEIAHQFAMPEMRQRCDSVGPSIATVIVRPLVYIYNRCFC